MYRLIAKDEVYELWRSNDGSTLQLYEIGGLEELLESLHIDPAISDEDALETCATVTNVRFEMIEIEPLDETNPLNLLPLDVQDAMVNTHDDEVLVDDDEACPKCGERRMDWLANDDGVVTCQSCCTVYDLEPERGEAADARTA